MTNKKENLGTFDEEIDAARAYDQRARGLGRQTNFSSDARARKMKKKLAARSTSAAAVDDSESSDTDHEEEDNSGESSSSTSA